ncbi:hypothetical protein GGR56DRAFT_667274 [Xylariaceae sp. FL0804]|nr:hypothetical protein GGR56DRAFT_667274 [Xylariaceae sp. FL0804]
MLSLDDLIDRNEEDEEPKDKKSGHPNPHGHRSRDPSRSPDIGSGKSQRLDDQPTTAPSRRRGPSGRSSKSTATAASSSSRSTATTAASAASRDTTGKTPATTAGAKTAQTATTSLPATTSTRPSRLRRRSRESTVESMDHPAYGSAHGRSTGSSGMAAPGRPQLPTRPAPTSRGESNMPVRLTPITGRVSKAKKGVPVHTCEICRPPKTFTRAEHLRRHQLVHKTPNFQCTFPGCDKTFFRQDLLARHAQRQYVPVSSTPPPPSYTVPGYHGRRTPSYPMSNPGSSIGPPTMSPPPQHPGHKTSYPAFSGSPPEYIVTPGIKGYDDMDYQTPRTSPPFHVYGMGMTPGLSDLKIPDTHPPGLLGAHDASPLWASSASESNFSTPSEPSRQKLPQGYTSPSVDWTAPHPYQPVASHGLQSPDGNLDTTSTPIFVGPYSSPVHQHPVYNTMMDPAIYPDELVFEPSGNPFSAVRSPTPPTVMLSAQPAENLVTLAPTAIRDVSAIAGRQKPLAAILGPYSGAALLTAITLSPAVQSAIPEYLEVYWKRFDSIFPLVHRRSRGTVVYGVLQCAMAAIGSQFLPGKEDRLRGNELHEFAWKEVQLCHEWDVQVMQCILLCEFYSRFRGRKVARRWSQPFQSLYSRVADLQKGTYTPTADGPEGNWIQWIEAESRRRLLSACFAIDVHTSMYHEHSFMHQLPTPTTPIPLIQHTADLWNAETPEAWTAAQPSTPFTVEQLYLCDVSTITPDRIAAAPSLDAAVFLASETLRLPRRASGASSSRVDLSAPADLGGAAERMSALFPDSPVANTYLALHYTPLFDLLVVSGDTWAFSRKELDVKRFELRQDTLKRWSVSSHAGAAARYAARALLGFLQVADDDGDDTTRKRGLPTRTRTQTRTRTKTRTKTPRTWNMTTISDYWGMYACTLICWALTHRGVKPRASASSNPHHHHNNTSIGSDDDDDDGEEAQEEEEEEEEEEREARAWLRRVAGLPGPEAVLNSAAARTARREAGGVVGMVRRRLEDEAAGGRSRLLVDALDALWRLEEP